jgi:hypothetical protein
MLVYKVQHNVPDGGYWKGGQPTHFALSHIRHTLEKRNVEPNDVNCFIFDRISKRKGKIWNSAVSLRTALKQLPKEILDILVVKEYELMPARTMSAHELAN